MGNKSQTAVGLGLLVLLAAPSMAPADDQQNFCRDFWNGMAHEQKLQFEMQADLKAALKVQDDDQAAKLFTCWMADENRLLGQLDALCAQPAPAAENAVGRLAEHVRRCAPAPVTASPVEQQPTESPEGSDAKRLKALEREVEALKTRVEKLEAARVKPVRSATVGKGNWKEKNNWRALRVGMGPEDVRTLLGEPERVVKNEFGTQWDYGSYLSFGIQFFKGSVDFAPAMEVKGWTEP